MRILLTNGDYRHTLAIRQRLLRYDPSLKILAHKGRLPLLAWFGGIPRRDIVGGTLEQALAQTEFDQVIPVGGKAVVAVAEACPEKAVLPSRTSLEICLNKDRTTELANKLGVPCPRTWAPTSVEEALSLDVPLPCVIKSGDESKAKFVVLYAKTRDEFTTRYQEAAARCAAKGGALPLIQEYVTGVGAGFFALYQKGQAKWIFMHRRLREWPLTGGSSTAAAAFYHPQLKEYGLKLLDALGWHGVAMVEFKYDPATDRFWLIEINPKFWGSLALALASGVDFPVGLHRIFRGETLEYSEEYNRNISFYWPLPNDLRALLKMRHWRGLGDYFRKDSRTDFLEHPLVDLTEIARIILL